MRASRCPHPIFSAPILRHHSCRARMWLGLSRNHYIGKHTQNPLFTLNACTILIKHVAASPTPRPRSIVWLLDLATRSIKLEQHKLEFKIGLLLHLQERTCALQVLYQSMILTLIISPFLQILLLLQLLLLLLLLLPCLLRDPHALHGTMKMTTVVLQI